MHKALITGGSRGIGAAICRALRGADVEVLAPARAELDLADAASIRAYVASPAARGVDILVNNAGINVINALEDIRPDDFAVMLQVNLNAALLLMQALAPPMRAAGWGRIVNISSVFGVVTRLRRGAYSATKTALIGLTRAAAVEMAKDNVLVNAVCPGYVETELTRRNNSPDELAAIAATIPAGRLAQPEEIAGVVAFLCSEANTYLTGQALAVDGGFTCV
jgi:3-oxoacyl-[acyl-carrier protein] reductase